MQQKLSKIYLEITNVCNLSCSFCHKTHREKRFMSRCDFMKILEKIKGRSDFLYFHLMGEPLLHPDIREFASIAHAAGFDVMITTNGTLVSEKGDLIRDGNVKKVSISLHSLEPDTDGSIHANEYEKYLEDCFAFAKKCAEYGVICVLRLWNIENDHSERNAQILARLHEYFPDTWIKNRSGFKLYDSPLGQNEVYLEYGEKFEWPDIGSEKESGTVFCHALRSQLGILCDGTVVPCCMDADGSIPLGNLLDGGVTIEGILSSERATAIYDGFTRKEPCEKLCKSCGYAARFK